MGFGPEEGSMTPDIAAEFLGLCADEGLADAPPDPLEKIFGHLALASHGIDADVLTADAAPHDAAMAKIYADLERNEKENPAGILAKASSSSTRILEKRFRHKDAVKIEKTRGVIAEFNSAGVCVATYHEKSAPTTMQTETDNWGF